MPADYRPLERVSSRIEADAKYYPPDLYRNLLTFHQNLTLEPDELSNNFIPCTGAKPNPKPFIVGILPPNLPITGRLLDRSASIVAQEQLGTGFQNTPAVIPAGQASTGNPGAAPAGSNDLSNDAQPGVGGASLPQSFWVKYVEMCNRLGIEPLDLSPVINNESGFKPGSQNFDNGRDGRTKQAVAKGLNQLVKSTATGARMGMTDEEWSTYQNMSAEDQLYWVEKFYQGSAGAGPLQLYEKTFGGYTNARAGLKNPDGSYYASKEWQEKYSADHANDFVGGVTWPQPAKNDAAYRANKALDIDSSFVGPNIDPKNPPRKGYIDESDLNRVLNKGTPSAIKAQIEAAMKSVGKSKGTPPSRPGGGGVGSGQTNPWASGGSSASKKAFQRISKTANKDVNLSTELGRDLQSLQESYIRELSAQVEAMRNTPPLRFLVNPASFKVSSEKIVSDGTGGRDGPIIEHWGDGQDKIDFSGKIAAFYTIDPGPDPRGSGLSRTSRNFSASFKNFMSLYLIYRNNGALYTRTDVKQAPNLAAVGTVYIYYDGVLYLGSFDNFTITESEDAPFSLEYSVNFTVRMEFHLDLQVDETLAYGAPRHYAKPPLQTTSDPFNPALATVYDASFNSNVTAFQAEREAIANNPEVANYLKGVPQSGTNPGPQPGTGTTTQPATTPKFKTEDEFKIFLLTSNPNTGKSKTDAKGKKVVK